MTDTALALRAQVHDLLGRAIRSLEAPGRRAHEGVHGARRAMRRARACLALAGLDRGGEGERCARALAKVSRGLSALRDASARVESIDRLLAARQGAERARILRSLRRVAVRERSLALAHASADDPGFARRRLRLSRLRRRIDALGWSELTTATLEESVERSIRRSRSAERSALAGEDFEAWHRFRRRVRRLHQQRLALEECDDPIAERIGSRRELAHRLGELQELAMFVSYLSHGNASSTAVQLRLIARLRRRLANARERVRRSQRELGPTNAAAAGRLR